MKLIFPRVLRAIADFELSQVVFVAGAAWMPVFLFMWPVARLLNQAHAAKHVTQAHDRYTGGLVGAVLTVLMWWWLSDVVGREEERSGWRKA